jgi:CO/xanthine dehydrogenase Mo-binding subunit
MIGERAPRIDSEQKVRGGTRFAADLFEPGLLHARLVLSQHARARIGAIDAEAALELQGVVAVLTAEDLPIARPGDARAEHPLAAGEVVFAGQPVAIVVADSEAAAEDGVEAVVVEYEPMAALADLPAAMALDASSARVHTVTDAGDDVASAHTAVAESAETEAEDVSVNVVARNRYREGDARAALAASDAVVAARFETGWLHQAYLEPQTAVARVEPDGELVVTASTQAGFFTRDRLAQIFGLPQARVRVVPAPLGGAFGGKLLLIEPLAAGAALALGRPVRLSLTRTEDFLAGNPNPGGFIELEVGGMRSGELTGLSARVVYERGVLAGWGIDGIAGTLLGGVYRWPAFDVRAYGVETNRPGMGAYRAPGAPPAHFALESALDELAGKLDLDPVDLRLRNIVEPGDSMLDGRTWPRIGAAECLGQLREHALWRSRAGLPENEGVGLAIGVWPGASSGASAACRFDGDGGITVVTGAADMSGVSTGFAAIAAEVFGVPPERVRVVNGDTASAPKAPISGGSQVTYSVGRAVERAAENARRMLLEVAAAELETDADDLEIVDGVVQPRGAPAQGVPLTELAERVALGGYEPVEARGGTASTELAPSVAAHLAHVRVDRDTGEVAVLRWVVAQDVGRVLNPALCEGQMLGGVTQGIGWALLEELLVDDEGQALTGSFMEYAVPRAVGVPEIETILVEVPAPHGPLGAKGIGEAPVVGAPAAVANAIAAATGVRMRRLPMTAPRIWAALGGGQAGEEASDGASRISSDTGYA